MYELKIPPAWRELDVSGWRGSIVILGASDSGKSTFARYLYARLLEHHPHVGFLDADVGQNSLGPPATLAIALNERQAEQGFPPGGPRRLRFVGNNTPRHCFLAVLAGLYRMLLFSLQAQAGALVVDTSGFVDPLYGGAELKWAKLELFRPCRVVALQRAGELEAIVAPLRAWPGVRLLELPACEAVRARSREERRAYRAASYRAYFQPAQRVPLPYRRLAVFPARRFVPGQLAALEGRDGFVLGLAVVERADDSLVWLSTPWPGQAQVAALRLGTLRIDRDTFQDAPLYEYDSPGSGEGR